MIHLVESPSAALRQAAARVFLESFPAATEILVVGFSHDCADELVRVVTRARGATFGLHRASLTDLAVRIAAADMARAALAPGTALGAEAIAARVAFEANRQGSLPYFAPVARFPGFARAVARTLGDLRLAAIDARQVGTTGAAVGTTGAVVGTTGATRDVAEMLRRFEHELERGAIG